MLRVTVQSNAVQLAGKLDAVATEQIPFASALALTRLAQGGQRTERGRLSQVFTIRNTFVSRGLQIRTASKKDWPLMSAEIGTRDEFMARQALGGTKTGRDGGQLAIPLAARPTPMTITKPSQWPGPLLRSGKAFLRTIRTGPLAGRAAVLQRTGQGRDVRVMYYVAPSVKVRKRWPFVEQVSTLVQARYDKEFGEALAQAIASAR